MSSTKFKPGDPRAAAAGVANSTKFKPGDPRAAAAGLRAVALGHGLKDGDPRNKALGRLGGLKSAAMRAAKRAAQKAVDSGTGSAKFNEP